MRDEGLRLNLLAGEGYRFPKDKGLTEINCKAELNNIIKQYEQRLSSPKRNPNEEFERLLPTCKPGGSRFQSQNFLAFFAGKDLLYGMREELSRFGFESPVIFGDSILKRIEETGDLIEELLKENKDNEQVRWAVSHIAPYLLEDKALKE
ncbi:MAG: hypothetical protein ACHBN1_29850 [Heteroscytonema crispum UTEX LB 1556]